MSATGASVVNSRGCLILGVALCLFDVLYSQTIDPSGRPSESFEETTARDLARLVKPKPALPAASVQQLSQTTFRVTVRKLDGWYDTRLPYVPGCNYSIRRTDANEGKFEFTAGQQVYWYDAGYWSPNTLGGEESRTIKLRLNAESPFDWMVFEVSRNQPIVGACYAPVFAPIPLEKSICDLPVVQIGDDTPPMQQGLNLIAPLFGAQPIRTPPRITRLPSCPGGEVAQIGRTLPGLDPQSNRNQRFAYFRIADRLYYGDGLGNVFPVDPYTRQIIGPPVGRLYSVNGQWIVVDRRGRPFLAVGVQ